MKKQNLGLLFVLAVLACPSCKLIDSSSGTEEFNSPPAVREAPGGSDPSGPTPTPLPSASPAPKPTATATPRPTATPVATPKPSTPSPTPAPTPVPSGGYVVEYAPLWEAKSSTYRSWTLHSYSVVDTYGAAMMAGSNDVRDFCPAFFNLTPNQKLNFWAFLVSAITKFESAFNPASRYVETTMGTDPVTGEQVASEGLLQLSYQDGLNYKFCNEFDWSIDSQLSRTDPRKTIFDPKKNLSCGIRILNRQIERYDAIKVSSGAYWSVLKIGSSHNHITEIQSLTNAIPFCKL